MLYEVANNYFGSINPLAGRISHDINGIKEAYASLWQDLSCPEQNKIIDQSIIYPQIVSKYAVEGNNIEEKRTCKFACGNKIVCDETSGAVWRDEHSAPFSWRSQSLLVLCQSTKCIPAVPVTQVSHIRKCSATTSTRAVSPNAQVQEDQSTFFNFYTKLKLIPGKALTSLDEGGFITKMANGAVGKIQNTLRFIGNKGTASTEHDVLVSGSGAVIVPAQLDKNGSIVTKPKGPPPPPPPRVTLSNKDIVKNDLAAMSPMLDVESHDYVGADIVREENSPVDEPADSMTDLVPKSGFDFLDDW